jgi:hypothetical protein
MDALAVAAWQAEEPAVYETAPTAPVVDEAIPMTGSKRAASIDDRR